MISGELMMKAKFMPIKTKEDNCLFCEAKLTRVNEFVGAVKWFKFCLYVGV